MEGGYFIDSAATAPWFPYVYTGGSAYALNRPATDIYTTDGAGIVALNTSGQAVGFSTPGNCRAVDAAVWTYTISGGSVASQTATDIGTPGTSPIPTAETSTLLAINSSGKAVGSVVCHLRRLHQPRQRGRVVHLQRGQLGALPRWAACWSVRRSRDPQSWGGPKPGHQRFRGGGRLHRQRQPTPAATTPPSGKTAPSPT